MLKSEQDALADLETRVTILETQRREQLITLGIVIGIFVVIFLK